MPVATTKQSPATTLKEMAARISLEPLPSGDARYVDMGAGRGSRVLQKLRNCLDGFDASENNYAKIAFTGHRGCGKSTELLRLERNCAQKFTCLHLFVDESLIRDCDYTDLLLWLTDALVHHFAAEDMRLPGPVVDRVVDWFAERTLEDVTATKTSIAAELSAEAQSKWGVFGTRIKLLGRIKAQLQGNVDRRTVIRHKLQNYSRELVDNVNDILDEAQNALERAGRNPDLLIVQDNLDRLPVDIARRLFFDHGDLLKQLRAHVIFTVPIAMVLAPWDIGKVFEMTFTMPMVKVRNHNGTVHAAGVGALVRLIAGRADLQAVFDEPDTVPQLLADACGGSVRDLLRLLNDAQLEARTDNKTRIDAASVKAAIKNMRIDFERLLLPVEIYFPILTRIHQSKLSWQAPGQGTGAKEVQAEKEFFSQLLFNGTVLEYNGDRNWYDVHPIVQEIEAFRCGGP